MSGHETEVAQALTPTVRERIASDFRPADQPLVERELQRYAASADPREIERVQLAILELAHGNGGKASRYTDDAIRDYRDVLYRAYYQNDGARDRG